MLPLNHISHYTNTDGSFLSKQAQEDYLFANSETYFIDVIQPGIGAAKHDIINAPNYPAAMLIAMRFIEDDKRALLYFNSTTTLGVCIPRDKFEYYLQFYNRLLGTKYVMPKWKVPLNPKTKG